MHMHAQSWYQTPYPKGEGVWYRESGSETNACPIPNLFCDEDLSLLRLSLWSAALLPSPFSEALRGFSGEVMGTVSAWVCEVCV